MRILLVEDNAVDRFFVTRSLSQVEGFDYVLCPSESLSEAIEQVAGATFDVILLDLWLPDSEGIETCSRMISAAPNTPIVVMTGTNDGALASEALQRGAQDYMVKGSFPGAAIARVMQYAIDRCQFSTEMVQQDQHFRQVMSHVPAMVWTTNRDLKISSIFGAGLQRFGVMAPDVVGHSVSEFFCRKLGADQVLKSHQAAITGKAPTVEFEWQDRIFHVNVEQLNVDNYCDSGTIGVAIDVTEQQVMDREIHFARLVQESLLPSSHPCLDGFDIFGASHPARQTCGDWFGYLEFPDGSLGLEVGDVCGKGFGPAILSASIAAYLEVLAERQPDLRAVLEFCNRMVCRRQGPNAEFAVLSLARLEAGQSKITYAGAGEQMLVVGSDGVLKHLIAASGIPVGLMDDATYSPPEEVSLDKGDILLMLTDGFKEAMSCDGELFGISRIVTSVASHRHQSAAEIFHALRSAALAFSDHSHQSDDMTGIIIKVVHPHR